MTADRVATHAREQVPGVMIVEQDYLGGTGHAVRVVLETVGTISGTVVVTYADTPLLTGATLARLVDERAATGAAAAVLTARVPDPTRLRPDHQGRARGVRRHRRARRRDA